MESIFHIFSIHAIFHYVVLDGIVSNDPLNIHYNVGKLYLSCIAGFTFVLFMMIHRHSSKIKIYTILTCTVAIIFFTYLYRNQIFINDKQYLIEMIDNSETSELINKKILLKTDNKLIKAFASKIKHNREAELIDINTILKLL